MVSAIAKVVMATASAMGGAAGMVGHILNEDGHKVHRDKLKGAVFIRRYLSSWIQFYLGANPTYLLFVFRQRFRVTRVLFLNIHGELTALDPQICFKRTDGFG